MLKHFGGKLREKEYILSILSPTCSQNISDLFVCLPWLSSGSLLLSSVLLISQYLPVIKTKGVIPLAGGRRNNLWTLLTRDAVFSWVTLITVALGICVCEMWFQKPPCLFPSWFFFFFRREWSVARQFHTASLHSIFPFFKGAWKQIAC